MWSSISSHIALALMSDSVHTHTQGVGGEEPFKCACVCACVCLCVHVACMYSRVKKKSSQKLFNDFLSTNADYTSHQLLNQTVKKSDTERSLEKKVAVKGRYKKNCQKKVG